jgi:hypothetical protein
MQSSPAQDPPQRPFLTIAQIIVSGLGLLGSLAGAGLSLVGGLAILLGDSRETATAASLVSLAWASALMAVLTLPSILFSVQRLRGGALALPRFDSFRLATILALFWPLVLTLGNWASTRNTPSWFLLPPLQILAVGLPVWWLVEFARRRIDNGSRQRGWGIVNFSLLITTPIVVVAEVFVFLILALLFFTWIMSQPDLLAELEALAQGILLDPSGLDTSLPLLAPYLQRPGVFLGILATLSGVVPLLEELLKPLAIWFLVQRRPSPAEGFSAGILCGASFALLESLLSIAGPLGQGWAAVAIGRAGTGLLHITTVGLVGWAMASSWQQGAYLKLGLTYLFSAALHGLWNALSVLLGLDAFLVGAPDQAGALSFFASAAPAAIIVLAIFLLVILWGMNRRLQQSPPPPGPAVLDAPQSY